MSISSVFWDLYCAAPERRDTCEHSSEAKAFHDYVSYYYIYKYIQIFFLFSYGLISVPSIYIGKVIQNVVARLTFVGSILFTLALTCWQHRVLFR